MSNKITGEDTTYTYTANMPIYLTPYGGTNFHLEFPDCNGIELEADKHLRFRIHTNRGAIEKELKLSKQSRYFEI